MKRRLLHRYLLTSITAIAIVVSLGIFALGAAGIVPTSGAWRALIIPAYLPMLIGAVLSTALSVPGNPVLWLVGAAMMMLPFAALDWLRSRLYRSDAPAR